MSIARPVDALASVMRPHVFEAVELAQAIAGQPVTAQQARAARRTFKNAHAFTAAAVRISQLGPDERGRELHVGRDADGFRTFWITVASPDAAEQRGPATRRTTPH